MKLIKPSYEILTSLEGIIDNLKLIEKSGRVCYKSEDRITDESYKQFIDKLLHTYHHESVIEHSQITVKLIIDRGISHEIVRHRLCSFSQESTRYCNYSKDKFDGHITFMIPSWFSNNLTEGYYDDIAIVEDKNEITWMTAMLGCEYQYKDLINGGWTPQQARSVLPNSLKTEIVISANFREWRHIFELRCSPSAHPQMREIMIPLLEELKSKIPIIFDDISYEQSKKI